MRLNFSIFLAGIISIVFPQFANAYNRAECDPVINSKRYLVAGSLDNAGSGGKTYNFDRIVGALENELLSGEPPRPKHFECLMMLHKKAHEDATDYWANRLARSECVNDKDDVPKVKPAGCDQDTWDKFHRSMALIYRSANSVTKLTTDCVQGKNGARSCEAMATLKNLQDMAEPIAQSNSDKCCDTAEGPAFRVLRSFYTVEFGDMSNAELQKECYKRTRPSNSGSLGSHVKTCLMSVLNGVGEALMKMFKSAKTLFELATSSETWRMLRNMTWEGVKEKLGVLMSAITQQIDAQMASMTGCFTGPYQTDQICKLTASIITDFYAGGKLVKYLGVFLKGTAKEVGALAKKLVESNPKAAAVAAKLKAGAGQVKAAGTATSAATRAAAKKAAAQLAAAIKPVPDFGKAVASRIRQIRQKEGRGGRSLADRQEPYFAAPNGAATMPASQASAAGSAANSGTTILNGKAAASLKRQVGAFRDSAYQKTVGQATRSTDEAARVFVKQSTLKGKTVAEKIKMIEESAAKKRKAVEELANAKNGNLSQVEARQMLANIDDKVARLRARYLSSSTTAGGRSGTGSGVTVLVSSTDNVAAQVSTEVPTVAAGSTSTAVIGGAAAAPVSASVTSTSSALLEALPKVDLNAIMSSSANLSKSLQTKLDNLNSFVGKARSNAAQSNPSSTARSLVYGNQSNRAISMNAIRRHKEIEALHKKGAITDEQALALHDIVRVTESSATGTATRFSTQYISTPNTNPSTFSLTERTPPVTVAGAAGAAAKKGMAAMGYGDAGALASSRQFQQLSGPNNQRFQADTVIASEETVRKISVPGAVSKEFSQLKTETEVLDRADELRMRVKVIESSLSANATNEQKDQLKKLLDDINVERDRALAKIKKATPPPPPPKEPEEPIEYSSPL